MDFSAALTKLKGGSRLTRPVWDDKRRAVYVADGELYRSEKTQLYYFNNRIPERYTPTPADIFSDDWEVV